LTQGDVPLCALGFRLAGLWLSLAESAYLNTVEGREDAGHRRLQLRSGPACDCEALGAQIFGQILFHLGRGGVGHGIQMAEQFGE
jgi:hypothetical protein